MKLTRYEKETIINFNEAEATANIYTHNGGLIRKLDALADQRPEEAMLREKLQHMRAESAIRQEAFDRLEQKHREKLERLEAEYNRLLALQEGPQP